MVKSILVPLDGSSFAETAIATALGLAAKHGEPLELILAHSPPTLLPGAEPGVEAALALDERIRSDEGAYLRRIASRVSAESGVTVTPVLLDGPAATTLIAYATSREPHLLVMTTHGRGTVGRLFLGSVADRLVRQLHCPVLLIGPGSVPTKARPDGRRHVLVPLDGSAPAEAAIDQVLAVFPRNEVVLELVQVVVPLRGLLIPVEGPLAPAGKEKQALLAANRYLHAVAVRLRKLGLLVHAEVHLDPSVADALITHAVTHRSDLIAIATHGLGGVERMLLGSVADKLVRGAPVPLLVWNPQPGVSSRVLAETVGAAAAPSPAFAAHH